MFYIQFFCLKIERIAHFLFFGEQSEWIAKVAHQKWAKEWITHFFERIAHLLILGQKTSDSLENRWANSQPWVKVSSLSLHCTGHLSYIEPFSFQRKSQNIQMQIRQTLSAVMPQNLPEKAAKLYTKSVFSYRNGLPGAWPAGQLRARGVSQDDPPLHHMYRPHHLSELSRLILVIKQYTVDCINKKKIWE